MNYLQQTPDQPLFPDMLWSKPENKQMRGKLLIIGGNSFGFAAVGEAYEYARKAGAGEVRVLLPDVIQKIAGGVFEHALFASTNPSGSFSKDALSTCLEAANWADGVLIVGDVSRNAETAALLERFCESYKGILSITKDALELLLKQSDAILKRSNTTLIMTMADLQLAAKQLHFAESLTHESPNEGFVSRLHELTKDLPANIIVKRQDIVFVVSEEKISATHTKAPEQWRVKTATACAVWHLQNPSKPFEALTTGLLEVE